MSEKGRERSFNRAAGITDFRSIALPRRAPVSAMRIAVIGAHGGTYGAALAKAGSDVTFVARGARLAAIRSGLRIKGDRCETHIQAVQATADIAGMGVVDYVLLCVKLWDDESAGAEICPIVGPQTSVVPLQNGVDAADRLIPILGCEAVMGGSAFLPARSSSPASSVRRALDKDDLRRTRRRHQRSRRAPAQSVRGPGRTEAPARMSRIGAKDYRARSESACPQQPPERQRRAVRTSRSPWHSRPRIVAYRVGS